MPRYIAILFALPLFFTGCEIYNKNKPTEFFKITEKVSKYESKSKFDSTEYSNKIEYFIVSNPPNDSSLLKKIIEEYNLRTMSVDTIKKYFRYERVFFRETECLNRNYEEGEPYPERYMTDGLGFSCKTLYDGDDPGQQVRYHYYTEDNLMQTIYVSYTTKVTFVYSYIFGKYFGDSKYKDIIIKDIDQFFEEGRKKLNLDSTEN